MDNEVKREIKLKNSYYKLLRVGRIERTVFNTVRNRVTSLIRSKKRTYFSRKFEQVKGDMKRSWSLINNIIKPYFGRKPGSIKELLVDGTVICESKKIADEINNYFSTVGHNIANSVTSNYDHRDFLTGNYINSFFLPPAVSYTHLTLPTKRIV